MFSATQTFRRLTAALCVPTNHTDPNDLQPFIGNREKFSSTIPLETLEPAKASNHKKCRDFRKKLVATAMKLRLKVKSVFCTQHCSPKYGVTTTETQTEVSVIPSDCTIDVPLDHQLLPEDVEEFSPSDFSHDVFYSIRALYHCNVEDTTSSNRNLALYFTMSNVTTETSVATIESSKKNPQTLFAEPSNVTAAKYSESGDDVVDIVSTSGFFPTKSPFATGVAVDEKVLFRSRNMFTPLSFKRLLHLFLILQALYTCSAANVKRACQGTFDSVSVPPVLVDFSDLKCGPYFDSKLSLSRVVPVRSLPAVVSRDMAISRLNVEYLLWNIHSWTIPKLLTLLIEYVMDSEEFQVTEENENGEIEELDQTEKLEENETTEENEKMIEDTEVSDFVISITNNIPDYRLFYLANVEYQVVESEFTEIPRTASVLFSDLYQIAELDTDEAPLGLGLDTDSETYVMEPLKSCLKRRSVELTQNGDSDERYDASKEFADLKIDDSWFQDLCDRFVGATKIRRWPDNAGDEYWQELEYFITTSRLTFSKLSTGIANVKSYGLHEYVDQCDWAVKLVVQLLSSYLGMANRLEVLLETYRHANTLWLLDDVRCLVYAERKCLLTLRKKLNLVRNGATALASQFNQALEDYVDKSSACVGTVSSVLMEFDEFVASTLARYYPNYSRQELDEICGKKDFINACGEYHRDYLRDAKLFLTCTVEDITEGVEIVATLDAYMDRELIELSKCVWMEMKMMERDVL